jgi:hypothetical protein
MFKKCIYLAVDSVSGVMRTSLFSSCWTSTFRRFGPVEWVVRCDRLWTASSPIVSEVGHMRRNLYSVSYSRYWYRGWD